MTTPLPEVEESFFSEQRSGEVQYEEFSVSSPRADLEVSVVCGYRRSRDLDDQDGPGQDFISVYAGKEYVVGVVADGVGQSFFGDLAAREVAKPLVDYLWERRDQPPTEADVVQLLAGLTEPVQEKVQSQTLSVPRDSLLGKALEEIRQYGSQTVFSAFIYAAKPKSLDLYQVGDTRVWVHSQGQEPELLPENRGRWSSTGTASLLLDRVSRSNVTGFLVHSDGLRKEWARMLPSPQVSRAAFHAEVDERQDVDDLSFVSVLQHSPSAEVPAPEPETLAQPFLTESRQKRRKRIWPPRQVVAAFLLGFFAGAGLLALLGAMAGPRVSPAGERDCPPGCTAASTLR